MALNKSVGNMYDFVTHTWNNIIGICFHGCLYCYMKKLLGDKLKPLYFNEKELKTDPGSDNFIFVGSSTDAWAANVPSEWIKKMLDYCDEFDNRYLFQSKNPRRFLEFVDHPVFQKSVVCTTIESNYYFDEMGNAPKPQERAAAMQELAELGTENYVTVEPVMEFQFEEMLELLLRCKPKQVNIGKNTNHKVALLEPIPQKLLALGRELERRGIKVVYKANIKKYIEQ